MNNSMPEYTNAQVLDNLVKKEERAEIG